MTWFVIAMLTVIVVYLLRTEVTAIDPDLPEDEPCDEPEETL